MIEFSATILDKHIVLAADFLPQLGKQRTYDVVLPDDILPDNLVFVLGAFASWLAAPPVSSDLDLQSYITASLNRNARGFIQDDRTTLVWTAPRVLLPKNQVKLLLNLLLIAQTAVPRGGTIEVILTVDGEQGRFKVISKGLNARIPAAVPLLLKGEPESGTVDAHSIQPFYTGLIAKAANMTVEMSIEGDTVTTTAEPIAG